MNEILIDSVSHAPTALFCFCIRSFLATETPDHREPAKNPYHRIMDHFRHAGCLHLAFLTGSDLRLKFSPRMTGLQVGWSGTEVPRGTLGPRKGRGNVPRRHHTHSRNNLSSSRATRSIVPPDIEIALLGPKVGCNRIRAKFSTGSRKQGDMVIDACWCFPIIT